MDNTIDTGDPWDLGEQEQAPAAGGMNPLAEGTGLFPRKQAPAAEADEAGDELPEPALPDAMDPSDDAAEGIESALQELEAAEPTVPAPPAAGGPADEVEQVLQELEKATNGADDSFELIPPPPPDEIPPMYETYTPGMGTEPAEPSPAPEAEAPVIPPGPPESDGDPFGLVAEAPAAPAPEPEAPAVEPVVEAAPEPTTEPVVEPVVEHVTEEPVEDADPVEIAFGKPNAPEGSEQPTGKATQIVTTETMTRPALLTTDDVAGAKIAPVDMVMAVAAVATPDAVASAMESVLEELRDRCVEAGGDVVIGVKTEISSAGTSIMVTAAGTAVSLL